jgi:nicotinamide riboside kinase
MGLFSFLKKNGQENTGINKNNDNGLDLLSKDKPVIAEDKILEKNDPLKNSNGIIKGINEVYAFLQTDFESKGYHDALINPDDSYRKDNIKLLKHDLIILIQKVTTYYEDLLRDIGFHINSRERAGLIDLVEELKFRQQGVEVHLIKVSEIRKEMNEDTGVSERIMLSYQKGFMRGLSAISQSNVLTKEY